MSHCSYFKLPEDGTAVPKHVAAIYDCTVVYVIRALVGLVKQNQHPVFDVERLRG